jgi:hypothetical protein
MLANARDVPSSPLIVPLIPPAKEEREMVIKTTLSRCLFIGKK